MSKVTATALADAQALISTLETRYLRELQGFLVEEIRNREKAEKRDAIAKIHQIAAEAGLSPFELESAMKGAKPGKHGKRGPVEAKYAHPEDPSIVWTGRGRAPHWYTHWVDKLGSADSLLINKAA